MLKSFLFLLILVSALYGQSQDYADSLLGLMKNSPPEEVERIEELLILKMYIASYDSAKALSDKLLLVSPGINNNSLYIKALIHSYRFHNFNDRIKMLDKAQRLAIKEDKAYLLSGAYSFKALVYRDNSMTDSAMIYALKAKDVLEALAPQYKLGAILQLIADLHFYAGQYDDAEKIYNTVLEEKTNDTNPWRNITIYNNIGLIRIKQKRFADAEKIFLQSLNLLASREMSYADSTGLAYIFRKMLEVTLYQKKYDEAESFFIAGKELSERFRQTAELPGLYASKGTLCLEQGEIDSALHYYKKAEYYEKQFPDYGNQIAIFGGLATAYRYMNDNKRANDYLYLLLDSKNKSDSVFYRARYMNTFAEYNYKNYLKEIDHYKNQQIFFIVIVSMITVSLFFIQFLYIKINRAHKKLVQKNIEAVEAFAHHEISEPDSNKENLKNTLEIDEARLKTIATDLEKLMLSEKPFLNKDISLGKIAEMLGTNRSYLSRAINSAYQVNFNLYINDMRIKEAIHIISSGEFAYLNIEGIAEKSGFSNRVSFTKAFQKFTGVSPSFFINNIGR